MAGRTKHCPEYPFLEVFELPGQHQGLPGTTGGHDACRPFSQVGLLRLLPEEELVLNLHLGHTPFSAGSVARRHLPAPLTLVSDNR